MTDLEQMAAKCEMAVGPNLDIDHEIHDLLGGNDGAPLYTASLDAALSLVPDGWTYWSVSAKRIGKPHEGYYAEISRLVDNEEEREASYMAKSAALALTAAALRARSAK